MILTNKLFFEQVEQMLAQGHEVQIRVKGHSMRPLLHNERDRVVLAPCDIPSLKPGDIVLFRLGERHILHRIVARDAERFTLAGDGNYLFTEHCTTTDIAARAMRVIRPSGRVIACDSRSWRLRSRLWLALPPLMRRVILAGLWRLGWR